MDIETAEKQLCIRLYQWALADFEREARQGYPLLSTVQHPIVASLVAYLSQLSIDEQLNIASSFVNEVHRDALVLLGKTPSPNDKLVRTTALSNSSTVQAPRHTESLPDDDRPQIPRRMIRKVVIDAVTTELGIRPEKFDVGQWFYRFDQDDWQLSIFLDSSGTWGPTFSCFHFLVRADATPRWMFPKEYQSPQGIVKLSQCFSLLNLYGIFNTEYDIETEEQMHKSARSLSLICGHLKAAFPSWVEGLGPDDPPPVSPQPGD